jgi:multicomponent Na+:H+ antiporter subunit B
MKHLYIAVIVLLFGWLAAAPVPPGGAPPALQVVRLARETGVPNTVTGVLLRNRLYDTIFEVIVFTVAVLGVTHYLSTERPAEQVQGLADDTGVILARFGAMIAGMVALELAIRGHLGPGGGFAAGVAGGTAAGLVAVTSPPEQQHHFHRNWHVPEWDKASVLLFLLLAGATLAGMEWPRGIFGNLVSGGAIPVFNLLIAVKVAIGSWTIALTFIRFRGLL